MNNFSKASHTRAVPTSICLILFFLLINSVSCNWKEGLSDSITPTDTLSPKITKMYIPGIPPENIKIDQVKRRLIVTLPKDYPAPWTNGVVLTMSPGAKQLREFPLKIDFCHATFNDATPMAPVTTEDFMYDPRDMIITDGRKKKTYRLLIKPEGEMEFLPGNKKYVVNTDETGDTINTITILNYIDTSGYKDSKVTFKDLKTGEEHFGAIPGCVQFGKIYFGNPYSLPPGEYSISVQKSTGRQTSNHLFITVLPGKFIYAGAGGSLDNNRLLDIQGRSLFPGNTATLEIWHNRTGEQYKVNHFNYDRRGSTTAATIPAGMKSGIYYSKLTYNGTASDTRYTIIRQNEKQPVAYYILTDYTNGYLSGLYSTNLVLKREQQYWQWPSPLEHIKKGRNLEIHIQSATELNLTYTVPIKIPKYWGDSPAWKEADYPTFTIPQSVKPGKYLYRIQYTDKDGVKQIGDWLERDVEIK